MIHRLLFVIALAIALPTLAAAQDSAARSTAQINGALDRFFGAGGTTAVDPAAAAAVDASLFAFTYDPAVSAQVRAEFLDAYAPGGDAATRDQLAAFVDQMTPELRQQIMDQGFPEGEWRADNLSDVIASAALTGFQIVQDLGETTSAQDNAVRDLVRVALDGSAVTALPNAEKQKQGELLLLATILTVVQLETARESGNAEMLDALKAAGRDVLTGFGLHPALFVLGPDGLETSAKFKEAAPRIEAGTTTFEAEFPEAAADYARLGMAGTPALPPVAATTPVTPLPLDTNAGLGAPNATPPAVAPPAPANPLGTPPADPVAGRYSGDGLDLELAGAGGTYTGTIAFQGQTFPVRVTARGDDLFGAFDAGGGSFDVTIQVAGDRATLASGGTDYALEKVDAAGGD